MKPPHSLLRAALSWMMITGCLFSAKKVCSDTAYLSEREEIFGKYVSVRGEALWPNGAKRIVVEHRQKHAAIFAGFVGLLILTNYGHLTCKLNHRRDSD